MTSRQRRAKQFKAAADAVRKKLAQHQDDGTDALEDGNEIALVAFLASEQVLVDLKNEKAQDRMEAELTANV
jgi:hypothetical protein